MELLLVIIRTACTRHSQVTSEKTSTQAWADIALLIGGVTLARAVQAPELADEIAKAVVNAVVQLHEAP